MPKARKCVEEMTGYVPGEPSRSATTVKLNQNESRYEPSPTVAEAVKAALAAVAQYPDSGSRSLRAVAAKLYGVDTARVMATNGSDEMLRILFQTYCDPGDEVAAFYPSYTYYSTLAAMQDAAYRLIDLTPAFGLPAKLDLGKTRLVFLPNPNAPTGTLFPQGEIRRLLEAAPNAMVVVDEAYVDFAGDDATSIPLLDEYENLVVTRTFSKSYALAGLRIGLGFAREEALVQMEKVRDYYNVDRLGQAAAEAALRDREWFEDRISRVIATRERVKSTLERLGLHVHDSRANFLLVDCGTPRKALAFFNHLRDNDVLVRYFSSRRVDSCLRVTVGTEHDMDIFLRLAEEWCPVG